MTEATQSLIDEANATAYVLGIMAESAESLSTDTGMAEALNGMMLRLFEAARDSEQAEQDAEKDGIDVTVAQMVALAKELGITVDELIRAICAVNGEGE